MIQKGGEVVLLKQTTDETKADRNAVHILGLEGKGWRKIQPPVPAFSFLHVSEQKKTTPSSRSQSLELMKF